MTKKTAFITGATAGFGAACAVLFASKGYDLVITGRRAERLQTTQQNIENSYNVKVHTLCFDVQDKNAVQQRIATLADKINCVDVLINNAGLALGRDNFEDADISDWERMLQTNVAGMMYVTKATLPLLKKSATPHIINLGSIAGKEVYENGNGYCASKFAVDALSQSMRIDLLKYHIKVTAIHPGAADTEFSTVRYKGDEDKANATYSNFTPLNAQDVADAIFYCCSLPKHVCINDLVIMPTQQASASSFFKSGKL